MPWMIVIILLTLLDTLSSEVACIRLADIYWNVTNPIFRIDNTDHIIDVNKGNVPFEYDQVNIICPVYTGTKDDESERYIIYNVSKEEYDSCRITNPNPRIIAVCDKPTQLMYFTITFRSFTPQPGGLEFLPGHDYYFVSTSTGDMEGLHQRVGGRCATNNMKVIFKVCCDPAEGSAGASSWSQTSNAASNVSAPVVSTPETKTSPAPSASKPNFLPHPVNTPSPTPRWIRPQLPTRLPPPAKPYEVPVEDEMAKESTHNADGLDKLPNKARSKNEEFANDSWTSRPSRGMAILSTLASLLQLRLLTR